MSSPRVVTVHLNQLTLRHSLPFLFLLFSLSSAGGQVVINELMASNENTQADAAGEFDDWIELYNNDDVPVDLGGYFLSDKGDDPMKWMLPFGSLIAEGGYLIVWADEDQEQDGLHANFKLSKAGEALYFSNPQGEVIDSIVFGEQETDRGLARSPNGTGDFQIQSPTFGADNGTTDIYDPQDRTALRIYPNPARSVVRIEFDSPTGNAEPIRIIDHLGRERWRSLASSGAPFQLPALAPSRYYLRVGQVARPLLILP